MRRTAAGKLNVTCGGLPPADPNVTCGGGGLRPLEGAFAVFGLVWLSQALWRLGWDPYRHEVVYGVAGLAVAWLAWRRHETWPALRRAWPALLLVALALASTLWSIRPERSLRDACGLVATSAFGLFLATRLDLHRQVGAVALAFGGLIAAGLLLVAFVPAEGMMSGAHAGAWRGLFFNRNHTAPVAVLGAVACVLFALERTGRLRALAWLGAAACVLAAAGSRSRGAWLITPLALAALPILLRARAEPSPRLRRLLVSASLACAILVVVALPRLDLILAAVDRDHTLSGRTRIWDHSLDAVATRPWLGFGWRAFWRWAPEAETIEERLGVEPVHGHAAWMDLALDLGWIGVLGFAAGVAWVALRTAGFTRRGRDPASLWPVSCLGVLLAFALLEPTLVRPASVQWALYVALAATVSAEQA